MSRRPDEGVRPPGVTGSGADRPLLAGLEAGGTKWVCAVGRGPDDLAASVTFPTTTPTETIGRAVGFFRSQPPVAAAGIGCFGPVDLAAGRITTTPKPGWRDTAVADAVAEALGVPVAFDTDVNAAALGEQRHGAAAGLDTFVYLTVGTGIGGGVMAGGRLVHGLLHPEIGHMPVPHDRERDPYPGSCPFHGDCLEGLAAGPALRGRWGVPAEELEDEAAWELEAEYLALGLASVVCVVSPQRVVLGGGVTKHPGLIPRVRRRLRETLAGYLASPALDEGIDAFVVPPALGDRAGVVGALELARDLVTA